ncbi:MAG: copper-translocating P-type ATPase [Candidatus Nealsonbacteria bacterium RIFCSPHIGHO2_02_FULL_38_75]|nr:MAG: copper-translocating P-type ATPase [Candidatus Nealsonbacteria bacterium RIFCSPHIGHO2_02_FULL_38_75]OGZ23799.1 MAG: copper-translocating P-type ATPase [Candidatus Nealsonbacteria bacterium RIFCSPLOWO2_01_FULL_38_120]OGZ25318.1 MAG: copper-translocating P-type ATPase [Candidatus Nealsonbacteria bacterium RIFCSPLOWO2_02_FULL_38_63]
MHPEIHRGKEGLCPECGMRLIPVTKKKVGHGEHDDFNKHKGHSTNIFRNKFWISLVLSIPVVLYSDIVQELLQFKAPTFPGSLYVPFVLASIIFFYGGWVFIVSAFRELKAKLPGMMTLIALAISVAYVYSVYIILSGGTETLFWELATLITIMLLGHWMEMRAVSGAQSALKELSKLLPDEAEVIRGDKTEIVPLAELRSGEMVLVKPGGKIPTDGVVVEGVSDVNESIATGESKPVPKKQESEVIAGTINGDGTLKIKVTNIGENTFLAGVMRLVAEAQSSKSRLQMLSDRAAYYLTIIAVVVGGVTLVVWLALADPAFAVERMVAVLVIACPHALGLAIPLVASISTTKAAQNGFLVKQRLALEAARNIDVVLFDKTGTLTKGEFGVDAIIPVGSGDEIKVLQYAASVDSQSEHPIARAIVTEAKKRNIKIPQVKNFQRIAGKGARATIEESRVFVGSQTLLSDLKFTLDTQTQTKVDQLSAQGKTIIYVITENSLLGAIALADIIREESREAVKSLRDFGIKTAMITGDSEDVAKWVAGELGIDEYFAKVLPEQKSEKVRLLQSKGQKVAMVGDGVNDAPALTQADLGIAIGAGTNVAIESAGIILVRDDPRDIAKIIKLSRLTYTKMIQNLFWATGYNIVAIPLAAGVLASKGIFLQPALAAVFMSLSTVIVAVNAMMLRKKTL